MDRDRGRRGHPGGPRDDASPPPLGLGEAVTSRARAPDGRDRVALRTAALLAPDVPLLADRARVRVSLPGVRAASPSRASPTGSTASRGSARASSWERRGASSTSSSSGTCCCRSLATALPSAPRRRRPPCSSVPTGSGSSLSPRSALQSERSMPCSGLRLRRPAATSTGAELRRRDGARGRLQRGIVALSNSSRRTSSYSSARLRSWRAVGAGERRPRIGAAGRWIREVRAPAAGRRSER